jgi:hypothetical protein
MSITKVCGGFERAEDGRLIPPQLFADGALDRPFWAEGWVKVPFLDPEEVEDLAERFRRLRPHDGFDPRTVDDPMAPYHCTWLDPDHAYRREADEMVREFFEHRIRAVLPGYTIMAANIYVKPPGEGRFAIHQNWPTIDDPDIPTMTVWVPIQDTNFRNGGIRIVPGGHHVFPDIAAATSDRFFDDFAQDLIENYLEPMDVDAGEALIFDDSLLHWSGANRSASPRVTFQIEVVPEDARTVLWIRNPDDPDEWLLWDMDREYWIEYDFPTVLGRPEGLEFVRAEPNRNRRLTLAEFDEVMARADEIRRAKYVLPD